MIADLLPRYYEKFERNLRYEVLRSTVINGHEVAWMSFVGTIEFDIMGMGREGEPFSGRSMHCECDFTEGVGWKIGENGSRYNLHPTCLASQAALHLRHLELRQEYQDRFIDGNNDPFHRLTDCISEITLDLIKKGQAGEWLEADSGAAMYGGYFYLQTLAAIIDESMGHLWDYMYPLMEEKLIEIDGAIVKAYTQPPPPRWEEVVKIEDDGWTGIALLPGHRRMAQEWKFRVLNPAGEDAVYTPGQRLLHDPIFGPDIEDVERAKRKLVELLRLCRSQN